MPDQSHNPRYPLLEEMLSLCGLNLQPTYSNADIAKLFLVSIRAIQDRVAAGQLTARDLPGRAKFLPSDIEEFLHNSRRKPKK